MNEKELFRRAGLPVLLTGYAVLLVFRPEFGMLWLAGFAAAGIVLERVFPYHAAWQGVKEDSKVDGVYSVLSILLGTVLKGALTWWMAMLALGRSEWWPAEWPLALRTALALLLSGILPYWLHRIAHEKSLFLWNVHAVHHAPERVYSWNALRLHPLNTAWNVVFGLLPLLLIGADSQTILIAGGLNNFFAVFNHMNIDFRNPVLSRVFNTADLHRWHHSSLRELGDSNYGSGALSIWDSVFGSFQLPARKMQAGEAGLYNKVEVRFPALSVFKQMAYPFCRCT